MKIHRITCAILSFCLFVCITAEAKTLYVYGFHGNHSSMKNDLNLLESVLQQNRDYDTVFKKIDMVEQGWSQAEMEECLVTWAEKTEPEDVIIVYFACHGGYFRKEDGVDTHYMLSPTGSFVRGSFYDSSSIAEKFFKAVQFRAHLSIMVSDACTVREDEVELPAGYDYVPDSNPDDESVSRGGGDEDGSISIRSPLSMDFRLNPQAVANNLQKLLNSEGMFNVSASGRGEQAQSVNQDKGYGFYTYNFCQTLNTPGMSDLLPDSKMNGAVWEGFLNKVGDNTYRFSMAYANNPQKPYWANLGPVMTANFVIGLTGQERPYDDEGCIVMFVSNTDETCPAMRVGLKRGDVLRGIAFDPSGDNLQSQEVIYEVTSMERWYEIVKKLRQYRQAEIVVWFYRLEYSPKYDRYVYREVAKRIPFSHKTDLKFGVTAYNMSDLRGE